MEQAARDRLRDKLIALRERLLAEGNLSIEPVRADVIAKPDDDAAPLSEMGQVIASNRNRERTRTLRGIEDALRRMRQEPEDFGVCEDCGEDIPEQRLELLPWVRLCIDCQGRSEGGGPDSGGRKHITDYD